MTVHGQVLAHIAARWKAKGWWEQPTGGATKKAKAIDADLLRQGPGPS